MNLTFPDQLDRVRDGVRAQEEVLKTVAGHYADAIADGGLVHVYSNGHSRITVEETTIRMGALTLNYEGQNGAYNICPLSSIGALVLTQSLNELTIKQLDRLGVSHLVLQNMHLGQTGFNYDAWLRDQRKRYARVLHDPEL